MTHESTDHSLSQLYKSGLLESIERTTGSSYGALGRSAFPDFKITTTMRARVDPSHIPDWLLGYAPRPTSLSVRRLVSQRA